MKELSLTEFDVKVLVLNDIGLNNVGETIGDFITRLLCIADEEWIEIHYNRQYKGYSFNYLYPLADKTTKTYKKGGVYNFQIRVVDDFVEKILDSNLLNYWNSDFKVLMVKKSVVKNDRSIKRVFSVTPVIFKTDSGHWRSEGDVKSFEDRLKSNMVKKYKYLTGEEFDNEPDIYTTITIDNKTPISLIYKEISLLGDKITLHLAQDELSQRIAFAALGMGIGENNSTLGGGYLNYKY